MVQRSRAQRLNGLFPLSYMGVVPVSPTNFVMDDRAPTINDSKNFYIGDMWLDTSTQPPSTRNLWVLTSLVGNLATWDNFGSGDLETLTGNSGGPVFPLGNNINVVGDGVGITIAGNPGTHALTASLVGGGVAAQSFPTDSGTAVPNGAGALSIKTDQFTNTSGASLFFEAPSANLVRLRTTDLLGNIFLGSASGNVTLTGHFNSAFGPGALGVLTTGNFNTVVGNSSVSRITTGSSNSVFGKESGIFLLTGSNNIIVGSLAGNALVAAESSNILINNTGVAAESNTMRFGTQGGGAAQQNRAFMAGVRGVTTGIGDAIPVVIDSAGQLGTTGITPTTPCQFGAYKSLDSNNVTGDGTFYQVICDGELYDLGNNYDPITGIFTAPSTGTYHFDTYIACHNIADQNLSGLNIETTNVIFHSDLQSPVINKSIDNILHFQLSVDINMNAGDTTLIKIALGGGGGAKVVGVTGAIPPGSPVATYFSGHRLETGNTLVLNPTTYQADTGSASPIAGILGIDANNAALGCGSSVKFTGSTNEIVLSVTDASDNTILGESSGNLSLSGSNNTVFGANSFTAMVGAGSRNIVLGQGSGNNLTGVEDDSILINDPGVTGMDGLFAVHIPGTFDFHNYPANSSVNGVNVFLGASAGNRTMTVNATQNNVIGAGSLSSVTTGPHNCILGSVSALYVTSGDGNVLLGHSTAANLLAGTGLITGSRNVAIGYAAGDNWTGAESTNICIGTHPGVAGENRVTRIGSDGSADPIQAKAFIYGIRGITTDVNNAVAVLVDSAGQLGTVSSSMRYKNNIEPMGSVSDRLMDLEPVTFSWKEDQNYRQQIGLIAEEVEAVFPELVSHDKEGLVETVKYHELPVLLLNEFKKLSARVAELEVLLNKAS